MKTLIKKSIAIMGLPSNGKASRARYYNIKFSFTEADEIKSAMAIVKLEAGFSKTKVKNEAISAAQESLKN